MRQSWTNKNSAVFERQFQTLSVDTSDADGDGVIDVLPAIGVTFTGTAAAEISGVTSIAIADIQVVSGQIEVCWGL